MGRRRPAVTVERGAIRATSRWWRWAATAASTPSIWRAARHWPVIVPPLSGVFSAVGMLAADIEHTHLRTILVPLGDVTASDLGILDGGAADDIRARLARDAIPASG